MLLRLIYPWRRPTATRKPGPLHDLRLGTPHQDLVQLPFQLRGQRKGKKVNVSLGLGSEGERKKRLGWLKVWHVWYHMYMGTPQKKLLCILVQPLLPATIQHSATAGAPATRPLLRQAVTWDVGITFRYRSESDDMRCWRLGAVHSKEEFVSIFRFLIFTPHRESRRTRKAVQAFEKLRISERGRELKWRPWESSENERGILVLNRFPVF